MLRVNAIGSVAQAKSYYGEQLSRGDYYTRDEAQEIPGRWGGRAAERMGLQGDVSPEKFYKLADHENPTTGERLTRRRNDNRRVGYDFTFSAVKSVSAYYARTGDQRVVQAFQEAVQETMERDIEPEIRVRVRQGGQNGERTTGNGMWSSFTHFTSRPVAGIADPHLHQHVVLHNVTWDAAYKNRDGSQGSWMAAEVGHIKANGAYFQAAFHSRFAAKLTEMGFRVRESEHAFELAGFGDDFKRRFSRRTELIEAKARELGITHADDKADLGRKTREAKQEWLSMADLRQEWAGRMSNSEWDAFLQQAHSGTTSDAITERETIDYGLDHLLERQSVVRERDVVAAALQRGVGHTTPEATWQALRRNDRIVAADWHGEQLVSTQDVLAEERAMLAFARDGRGTQQPLGSEEFTFQPLVRDGRRFDLNAGQQAAVQHVLNSRSRVTMIRGAAGVGKTSLMQEAVRGIRENGGEVFTFTPTTQARDVLHQDGFRDSVTVAKLLSDGEQQARVRNGVLWIDEAGLLSTKDLKQVFDLAERTDARVILSGDYKQHASVQRGDAMRLLATHAGIKPAEVTEVTRQRSTDYKQAVEQLSRGTPADVSAGFDRLEKLGFVHEIADNQERYAHLAGDYLDSVRSGRSALVVSPTHKEADNTTRVIRDTLRADGQLGDEEHRVERLRNLNLTAAEKSNSENYVVGQVVQFHRASKAIPSSTFERETVLGLGTQGVQLERRFEPNSRQSLLGYTARGNVGLETRQPVKKGIAAGDRLDVIRSDNSGVHVRNDAGQEFTLPLDEGSRFSVYERSELSLAAGDKIRITHPGFSRPKSTRDRLHSLSNGAIYTVKEFNAAGDIVLAENGWTVDRSYGHLAHGYVTTSHASQGRTVDRVIVAQSTDSFPANNMSQFYVSVSRAKESVTLYTDDKQQLRDHAIQRSSQRLGATEVFSAGQTQDKLDTSPGQQAFMNRLREAGQRAAQFAREKINRVRESYGKWRARGRQSIRQQGVAYER